MAQLVAFLRNFYEPASRFGFGTDHWPVQILPDMREHGHPHPTKTQNTDQTNNQRLHRSNLQPGRRVPFGDPNRTREAPESKCEYGSTPNKKASLKSHPHVNIDMFHVLGTRRANSQPRVCSCRHLPAISMIVTYRLMTHLRCP